MDRFGRLHSGKKNEKDYARDTGRLNDASGKARPDYVTEALKEWTMRQACLLRDLYARYTRDRNSESMGRVMADAYLGQMTRETESDRRSPRPKLEVDGPRDLIHASRRSG